MIEPSRGSDEIPTPESKGVDDSISRPKNIRQRSLELSKKIFRKIININSKENTQENFPHIGNLLESSQINDEEDQRDSLGSIRESALILSKKFKNKFDLLNKRVDLKKRFKLIGFLINQKSIPINDESTEGDLIKIEESEKTAIQP